MQRDHPGKGRQPIVLYHEFQGPDGAGPEPFFFGAGVSFAAGVVPEAEALNVAR
jgi:hypothetical protein